MFVLPGIELLPVGDMRLYECAHDLLSALRRRDMYQRAGIAKLKPAGTDEVVATWTSIARVETQHRPTMSASNVALGESNVFGTAMEAVRPEKRRARNVGVEFCIGALAEPFAALRR